MLKMIVTMRAEVTFPPAEEEDYRNWSETGRAENMVKFKNDFVEGLRDEIFVDDDAVIEVQIAFQEEETKISRIIQIDADKFEHLLNCIANQKFIHEQPEATQKEWQEIIDKAYHEARGLLAPAPEKKEEPDDQNHHHDES